MVAKEIDSKIDKPTQGESSSFSKLWNDAVGEFKGLVNTVKDQEQKRAKASSEKHLPSVEITGEAKSETKPEAKADSKPTEIDSEKLKKENETIHDASNKGWIEKQTTISKLLAGKSPEELKAMDQHYKEQYGETLDEHLRSMVPPLSLEARARIATAFKNRQDTIEREKAAVDRTEMTKVAESIHKCEPKNDTIDRYGAAFKTMYLGEKWKPQEHAASKLLEGKTDAQREVIKEIFKEKYGVSLEDHLKEQAGGDRAIRILNSYDSQFAALPKEKQPEAREKAHILASELESPKGPDTSTVRRTLEKLDENERKVVSAYYEELTGKPLTDAIKDKFSGSTELELVNAVEYGSKDEVALMRLNIDKGDDKKVRTELRNMSKADIDEIDRTYQQRYGKSLREALMESDDLSGPTKKSLDIYLKGADKRTEQDWKDLLDIALTANDKKPSDGLIYAAPFENRGSMEMFQEIASSKSIPQEFRDHWLENGGKDKLEAAFLIDGYGHAVDYMKGGGLSLFTKINDNSGTINDDEDGVDKACDEVTDRERALYKRGLEIQRNWEEQHKDDEQVIIARYLNKDIGPDTDTLTGTDKEAYQFFRKANSELWDVADDKSEFNSYADRIAYKGGPGQAVKDIENMSRETWDTLKADPAKQAEYLKSFDHLSDGYRKRCNDLFAKKMQQESFELAEVAHNKSITEYVNATFSGFAPAFVEAKTVYAAIEGMNADDQRKYRDDPSFREKINKWVDYSLRSENQREAAKGLLDKVAHGNQPKFDFIDRIFQEGGKSETDESKVVRELENAFHASEQKGERPSLRERVTNPLTDEDKALAKRLDKALHGALESEEYDAYAKPLLETGRLSLEQKMHIHNEEETGKKAIFEDVFKLARAKDITSLEERKRLIEDKDYQQKVLGSLPEDQRKVAITVLFQGEVRAEDLTEAYMLGLGPSKQEVTATLAKLDATANDNFKSEYARKYDKDVTEDFAEKLSGRDEREMLREIRRDPETGREALRDVQTDVVEVRSGAGAAFVDNFTGTGHMVENSYYQMAGEIEAAAATGKDVSPERIKQLSTNVYDNIELNIEAKEAVADAVADVVLTVAAVAIPGGISLVGLTALGVGGGLVKIGTKSLIMGENYDKEKTAEDFFTGFIDSSIGNLAPGHIGKMVGIGKKVATEATERVVVKAVGEGGERLVFQGAEEVLERGTEKLAREAVINGSYKIADKEIDALARKVVREGASDAEVALVSKSIRESLAEGFEKEIRNGIKKTLTAPALEVAGGSLGAASSGLTRGLFAWDSEKSFSENMSYVLKTTLVSGAFGAGGAAAFTTVFRVGGKVYRGIAGSGDEAASHVASHAGSEVVAREGDAVLIRSADAPPVDGQGIKVTPDELNTGYQRVGESDYYIDNQGHALKRRTNSDGSIELVPDKHAMAAVSDDALMNSAELAALKMNPAERAALSERMGKIELAKSEVIEGFVDKAIDTTGKWDDLSALSKQAEQSEKHLQAAYSRYENEVIAPLKGKFDELELRRVSDAKKLLANDPEKLKILEEYELARRKSAQTGRELKAAVDARTKEIQRLMDDFADAHGLPRTKVKVKNNENMGGIEDGTAPSGSYADGELRLNKSAILSNENSAQLIDTVYHEFMHNEQDTLIIRALSDELRIGKTANSEEAAQIRRAYTERTGLKLSDEHLNEVLRVREGKQLSAHEHARAKELAEGFKNHESRIKPEFFEQGTHYNVTKSKYEKLAADPRESYNLVKELASDNGTLAKHLFGKEVPPSVKNLIERYKAGDVSNWPSEQASNVLASALADRLDNLNSTRLDAFRKYMSGIHEKEAHFAGSKAHQTALEKNHVEFDSRDTDPYIQVQELTSVTSRDFTAVPSESLIDRQIVFNGKRLDLQNGEISIGRSNLLAEGIEDDLLNRMVSSKHGKLKFDEATGNFTYEDISKNGTYIRRTPGGPFEKIKPGQTTVIHPGDEVRLGSAYGPKLQLSTEYGQVLDNGAVLFRRPEGDIFKNTDGSRIVHDRAGRWRWEDAHGHTTRVSDSSGATRVMHYGEDGQLAKVEMGAEGTFEKRRDTWVQTKDNDVFVFGGNIDVLPDGSLRLTDGVNPPTVRKLDGTIEVHHPHQRIEYKNSNLPIEKQRLEAYADGYFLQPEQAKRFKDFMQDFETRANARGLSEEEKALTYHHINRMISAGAEAPLSQQDRLFLAQQVLDQSARPHNIDQGMNNTCNVTTIENRIFTRNPSEAARLISDVATTGRYITADGTIIDLSRVPGALAPDSEASLGLWQGFDAAGHRDIRIDGRRTWASQLFETTAVNIKWSRSLDFDLQPGEVILYEKPYGPVPGGDTGERLYKYTSGVDGTIIGEEIAKQPHIKDYELTDINNQIIGTTDKNFVIRNGIYDRTGIRAGDIATVNNEAEFQQLLLDMHAQSVRDPKSNPFPAVLYVDVRHEPFRRFFGAGDVGGNSGAHVVNIQGILVDPVTGKYYVEVTNQWGSASNHLGANAIPLDVLYNATRPYKP